MSTPFDAQAWLNGLQIAAPCDVPWTAMHGDDRVRHCDQCDRKVYQLARLTADEAVELLTAGLRDEGRMPCVQLWRRTDGTVLTADCPVGALKLRSRRVWPARLGAAALLAVGLACGSGTGSPTTGLTARPERTAPPQPLGGEPMPPEPLAGEPASPQPAPERPGQLKPPAQVVPPKGRVQRTFHPHTTRGEVAPPPPPVMGKVACPPMSAPEPKKP